MFGEDFKALAGPSHSVVVSDAADGSAVTIPEQVLFNAQFKRVGDDLKLISANGDTIDIYPSDAFDEGTERFAG